MEVKNNPPDAPLLERWLVPFLETRYYDYCKIHEHMNNTTSRCNFFCINCIGAICEYCKKSQKHEDHCILQIRLASGACSVAAASVDGLIDTAGLHKFKINGYTIYFLCARASEGSKRKAACGDDSLCENCKWMLPRGVALGSRFCSILCKLQHESSPSSPLVAVSNGSGLKGRRIVVKRAGRGQCAVPLDCPNREAATDQESPAEEGLSVGSHGQKRARSEARDDKVALLETFMAEPALENKMASNEEEKTTSKDRDEEKEGEHVDPKINGVAVESHGSFRGRPRKGTPQRSAEIVVLQERNFWFFPW